MPQCLISFGANIGKPAETIRQAVELLRQRLSHSARPLQLSRFYRTPPVGGPSGQPPFVNAVATAHVDGSAWDAWHAVREVENLLGRQRQERWEARRIDLDVLLFEDERIWTPHFKVPHPRMCMRRFILEPAVDIAPDWVDPVSRLTIRQLAESLRLGAASLVLVSPPSLRPQQLLEEAAAALHASWANPEVLAGRSHSEPMTAHRWLGTVARESLTNGSQVQLVPRPKLVVALAEPVPIQGAAWEDYHLPLARWLGLVARDSSSPTSSIDEFPKTWPMAGPRYLLTTDDRSWAVHELVAACEAMDCPVEALPDAAGS